MSAKRVAAAIGVALGLAAPAFADDLKMMTGPQGGVWVPLGGALKNMWEHALPGVTIQALPGAGISNVRAVQEGASLAIAADAGGPRAKLRPEVLRGLRGEPLGEGLHGHWVQAYYVHLFLTDAGGRVFADVNEERVVFAATVPI